MSVSVMGGYILGDRVGVRARRVRAFVPHRVCSSDGCTTLLSIYNPKEHCAVHEC